ncbi:MAG: 23S rRNA (uracil-5-)-methyltransferase RumA [Candidatus Schekmanbacteria bacterium RBG_16_38_10]|uniref:23S rRNA (Uracil-5-)-methyltransferase RumA n=1 Tax=Candidatus Schekmanbacteria bacterium RBG_16_38_10 TaxID=1817879 RepID=A0A1F7RPJ7_9BACT|nr:MAG: 23S rRNA (uracil-5-)-methyltransferase RumA [Candidatus Schekmanbacteria bacterium RBG_16_38_10]
MIYGGYGLGRVFDKAILVPKVIPDETVRVKVIKEKSGYYIGEAVEIIKPSKDRITPKCPFFHNCGGCDYQHIRYQSQLGFKEDILTETLKRVGGLKDFPTYPIIPSPEPFFYRLNAQLKISKTKEGIELGFYQKDSHKFVPINECIICHQEINRLINVIIQLGDNNLLNILKDIEIIISNSTKKILLVSSPEKFNKNSMERLYLALKEKEKHIDGLIIKIKKKSITTGRTYLFEGIDDINYRVSSDSFFQVNYFLYNRLLKEVVRFVNPKKKENIFDIYCGVGTFTIPLANKANYVYGIEESFSSINDAIYNRKSNRIKNCDFIHDKAEDGLLTLNEKNIPCNTALLNPPREGCSEKTKKILLSFNPQSIIYLSCNPSTLARDLTFFLKKGYILTSVQPIDMFPQTYHIETLVKLEKA